MLLLEKDHLWDKARLNIQRHGVLQFLKESGVSVYNFLGLFVGITGPEPAAVHSRVLAWFVGFAFLVISAAYTYGPATNNYA